MAGTPAALTGERFLRIFNVTKDLDGETLKGYDMHGWSFSDFTRTGKLGLWNIHKFMELSRIQRRQTPDAKSYYVGVDIATIGTFTRELYRNARLDYPMACTLDYGYIGNRSCSVVSEYRSKRTDGLLATVERQVVTVDIVTRRPVPLPDYLAQLRNRYPNKGTHVVVNEPPTEPSGYHEYRVKVAASDTDQSCHVNQAIYHKYCMDAAYDAGRFKFLKKFTVDIGEYEVRKCIAKHSGESHAGDILAVCVWEDPHDSLILHFKITEDERTLFHSNVTFFPLETSRL